MKYIDTYWEKRNLGLESCRYILSRGDDFIEGLKEISECKKEYIEVFVDTGNIDLNWKLEQCGFSFLETMFELSVTSKDIVIPEFYKRFLKDVKYKLADKDEIEAVLSQILTGEMFLSDKIALNPKFGPEVAGKRYYNWMSDFFDKQGSCFIVEYRGELMGFEAAEEKDGIINLVLGGVLPKFNGSGLSPLLHIARAEYWLNRGFKKILGHVSSNNFPVLRVHEITGFKIDSAEYVFLKQK